MKNQRKTLKSIFLTFAIAGFIVLFNISNAQACEIDIKVIDNQKSKYSIGDELVVKVTVFLSHRNCPEGIKATRFKTNGIKILSATKWTEKNSGTFERKLKIKITGTKNGIVTIKAVRSCSKGTYTGSLTLKSTPS